MDDTITFTIKEVLEILKVCGVNTTEDKITK